MARLRRPALDFPDAHEETIQPWLWVRVILLVLVVAYLIAFGIKNHESSEIDFVFWSSKVSRIWLILLSLAFGLAGGLLLSQLYRHRQRLGAKRASKPLDPVGNLPGRSEAVRKPGGPPPA